MGRVRNKASDWCSTSPAEAYQLLAPLPGGVTMLQSYHLKQSCCCIVLVLLLMSCQQPDVTSSSTRTPASAQPTALARVTPHPDFADMVITLVNRERTTAGCPALIPNDTLIQV